MRSPETEVLIHPEHEVFPEAYCVALSCESETGCRRPSRCLAAFTCLHGIADHLWACHCACPALRQPAHQVI